MMRFSRTCGALAATLSLLSLEVAQAQSQRPPLGGARPVQNVPLVAPRPSMIPPDLSAVQLSPDQVEVLRAVLGDAYRHGFAMDAFLPDRAIELYLSNDAGARAAGQAQLVNLTLAYARAVRTGRLPISAFKAEWGLRPAAYDPTPELV
ncbi:MAG: murein L,D-transpeptidase, partial [Caulobacter sp.]|nr:murein L,D-transpeptidase [Caulobacter sp.]